DRSRVLKSEMSVKTVCRPRSVRRHVTALASWPDLVRWRQIMKRRDFLKQAGIGSATVVSLPALAQALTSPPLARSPLDTGGGLGNTFSVLLSGLYKPVAKCPDLG